MRRQDVARVAQMAPALKNLVVMSMPDCLLVEQWSAAPADMESVAALMGATLHAANQAARAISDRPNTDLVSIETPDALIFMCAVSQSMGTCFVFDRTSTLGLARIQIRDMLLELEPLLRGTETLGKPPAAVPMPVASMGTAGPASAGLASSSSVSRAPTLPPEGRGPGLSNPPPPSAAPNFDPTLRTPAIDPPRAPSEEPRPDVLSSMRGPVEPMRSAPPEVVRPSPPESPGRPRAVRLLEFLHRYAPDPHVSLLRLSLRTGISLERLDRPELLTNEQVESMAASVRDIIGQEQLGI